MLDTIELENIANIKTCTSLLNWLRQVRVDCSVLDWSRLYHITVGTHASNLFMTLDLSDKPRLDVCERTYEGDKYYIGRSTTINLTRKGLIDVRDFLNSGA